MSVHGNPNLPVPVEGAKFHGPGDWLVAWQDCTGLRWARFKDEPAARDWGSKLMAVQCCSELRGLFICEVRGYFQVQEATEIVIDPNPVQP